MSAATPSRKRKPTAAAGAAISLPRISWHSLWRRKLRLLNSLLALTTAAMLVAALAGLYRGVQRDIRRQFRIYGANLIATPPAGAYLSEAQLAATQRAAGPAVRLLGVLYAVGRARDASGQLHDIVIAGAHLTALRQMNAYWKVSESGTSANRTIADPRQATPEALPQAWLGSEAARLLGAHAGSKLTVEYGARRAEWRIAGIVNSGGSADNQIFAPLAAADKLTGLSGYTTLLAQAPAAEPMIRRARAQLQRALPLADVHFVRQIAANEGRIVLRTRGMLLASIVFILLTLALCVAAALAGQALERRREIGVFKALGSGNHEILLVFLFEHLWLGVAGGLAGYGLGSLAAFLIAEAVFQVPLWPGWTTLALSLGTSLILSTLAAVVPFGAIVKTHPAGILRGE